MLPNFNDRLEIPEYLPGVHRYRAPKAPERDALSRSAKRRRDRKLAGKRSGLMRANWATTEPMVMALTARLAQLRLPEKGMPCLHLSCPRSMSQSPPRPPPPPPTWRFKPDRTNSGMWHVDDPDGLNVSAEEGDPYAG